jgi:G protein-coupled receptor Mth (Methuselah protein)
MCRPVRTLLLVLSAVSVATSARNVTISKCCKFDESLSSTENKCLPVVHQPTWTLKVYSPAKQAYLPKDRVPPNWHLKAGVKPDCFRPALLTPHLGTYVPFQNGSLFVVEYNKLVHPGNYCIDYGAVLACLEDQPQSMSLVRVKKCCGSDGIFSETNNTCIHMRDSPYRIDLGPNKTLGTGFPSCSQQEIVFVGKLDEARMQDNGSLWLTKTKTLIPVGNYCLEHVFENAGRAASIMICQEHMAGVIIEKAETHDIRFTIYPIGLALSAVFLAATLTAGAILPASHHVLHWRCQTNHVACLLVGDVLLCITHLSGRMDHTLCILIGEYSNLALI